MPAAKCTKEIIDKVRPLVEINTQWSRIAAAVGVSVRAMELWRAVDSKTFNKEFAQMVSESKEVFNTGRTKAGQQVQSIRHTLKRTIFELREVDSRSLDKKEKEKFPEMRSSDKQEKRKFPEMVPPPVMPPSWFPKAYLIDYADQELDLILYPRMSVNVMRAECLLRIKELTVTVKVKVMSEQEVDPSQAAVKNVLTNTGKEDERWSFEEKHEIDASDPLKKLLEEIGGIKKGLPGENDIPGYDKD